MGFYFGIIGGCRSFINGRGLLVVCSGACSGKGGGFLRDRKWGGVEVVYSKFIRMKVEGLWEFSVFVLDFGLELGSVFIILIFRVVYCFS